MSTEAGTGHAADLLLLDALPGLPAKEQAASLERLLRNASPDVRGPAAVVGSAVLSDDRIVAYLREAADDVLRNAGLEMLKLRGNRAFPLCLALLKDRDADVVLQAVLALDHLKDPRALEPLRELLGHANANVVQGAIVAIGNVGHAEAAHDLLPFLERDPWLQFAAIEALGALRARSAVEPLRALLPDPILGALAAESLVWIGGGEAFRALAPRWMADPKDDTALELLAHVLEGLRDAPDAVDGFGDRLAERLDGDAGPGRTAAARCLLSLAAKDHDQLALEVLAEDPPGETTVPACLLRRPDLIGSLLESRGTLQQWGFLLAARHPRSIPTDALANALSLHRGSDLLEPIAEILGRVGGSALGRAILEFYDRLPPDADVGWGPLLRRHREALRPEVDGHPDVSHQTRSVLDVVLRESAEEVAAGIEGLPLELRALAVNHVVDWDDVLVRLPWLTWLREAPEVFAPVAAEVAERGGLDRCLTEIRSLLRDRPSADVVRLCARLGDTESIPLMVEILGDAAADDLHPFVIDALGSLGGVDARHVLHSVAMGGEARWHRLAVTALARCATPEDEPLFRAWAGHPDWQVRLACADVLSRSDNQEDRPALVQLFADPVSVVARRAAVVFER